MDNEKDTQIDSLVAENRSLRIQIHELEEKLDALKKSADSESATRMFRLVKEKNSQLDVTTEELEMTKQALHDVEAKLADSEDKVLKQQGLVSMFRQIITGLPGSVLCADVNGRIIFTNVKAESYFVNQSPLHGKSLADLSNPDLPFKIDDEVKEAMKNPLKRFEYSKIDGAFVVRFTITLLRGKGSLLGTMLYIEKFPIRGD